MGRYSTRDRTVEINTSYGEATPFDALKGGDCYFYQLHGKPVFAMTFKSSEPSVLSFVFAAGTQQAPWVAFGGHPHGVLKIPNVEIRPDLDSLHFGPAEIGELISSAGSYYLMGSVGFDRRTANLSSGIAEMPPPNEPFACFSRWAAGIIIDDKWVQIFAMPLLAKSP
jgi:hypothetical protein